MKNKLTDFIVRAAADLGITFVAPFSQMLRSGKVFTAEALLPELGAPRGTIVCSARAVGPEVREELKLEGYTLSSFDEPLANEEYDVNSYREMFIDWAWNSKEKPEPTWMK